MNTSTPFQESLFLDLPDQEEEENFERRVLEAIDAHKVQFTRRAVAQMGPAVEFVASVWAGDLKVQEVHGALRSLNFLHAESTARRALDMLQNRGVRAALLLNLHDPDELALQVEWILKSIKTTRPDGHPRARGGRK